MPGHLYVQIPNQTTLELFWSPTVFTLIWKKQKKLSITFTAQNKIQLKEITISVVCRPTHRWCVDRCIGRRVGGIGFLTFTPFCLTFTLTYHKRDLVMNVISPRHWSWVGCESILGVADMLVVCRWDCIHYGTIAHRSIGICSVMVLYKLNT